MRPLQDDRPPAGQVRRSLPTPFLFPAATALRHNNNGQPSNVSRVFLHYYRWSNEKPNVHFLKVDVDALPDLAADKGIKAMPTFHIYKNGEQVGEFVSANPPKLLELIEKFESAGEEETKAE